MAGQGKLPGIGAGWRRWRGWQIGVVVNSAETGTSLSPSLPRLLPVHVAPLGVSPPTCDVMSEATTRPYFLCVGTIEPRRIICCYCICGGVWWSCTATRRRGC